MPRVTTVDWQVEIGSKFLAESSKFAPVVKIRKNAQSDYRPQTDQLLGAMRREEIGCDWTILDFSPVELRQAG